MNDNNIYIVEAEGTTLRRFVSAASSTAARAAISRIVIKVRRAKPAELLGVNQAAVIDAETGLPLDLVVQPDDQALVTGNVIGIPGATTTVEG